jgi:hypothetical protein
MVCVAGGLCILSNILQKTIKIIEIRFPKMDIPSMIGFVFYARYFELGVYLVELLTFIRIMEKCNTGH